MALAHCPLAEADAAVVRATMDKAAGGEPYDADELLWRLDAAHALLVSGAPDPWPEVLVRLVDARATELVAPPAGGSSPQAKFALRVGYVILKIDDKFLS